MFLKENKIFRNISQYILSAEFYCSGRSRGGGGGGGGAQQAHPPPPPPNLINYLYVF